ncbi:polysaccharide biosynthesis/export family protein [Candidatus Sumerlaeota bacterium]|nr:polysaccharide biosynthesis/export family protein [Candidatus Sumerlaeota bacterium]
MNPRNARPLNDRIRPTTRLLGIVVLLLGAIAILTACSRAPRDPFPLVDGATPVKLAPGDEVQVKIRYFPDLNETQIVRPDGKIALEMIDDVQAEGLTPEELDEAITNLYEDKIKNPIVTVICRTFAAQRVYVAGEVGTPGEVPLIGRMTAAQAVMAAGGFDRVTAQPASVIVVRQMGGKQYSKKVDLSDTFSKDPGEPFYLAPMDIVYVPDKMIRKVNLFVDQYINRLVPAGLSYGHTLPSGDTVGYSPPGLGAR